VPASTFFFVDQGLPAVGGVFFVTVVLDSTFLFP